MGMFLLARLTADPVKRVRRFYAAYPPSCLTVDRTTMYMNFGYWENGCDSLDEASEALAAVLADAADFEPDNTILDVGFGYGDQDFAWLRDRKPRKIVGLNITPKQVNYAKRRATEQGDTDQLDFRIGSATAVPFGPNAFDRVVALECAFHFGPRSAFFQEAYRVLRPGGVLATIDLLPRTGDVPMSSLRSTTLDWIPLSVPEVNWHDGKSYEANLAATGFTDIRLTSIRDQVLEPWRSHVVGLLQDPRFRRRIGKLNCRVMDRRWRDQPLLKRQMDSLDYVVVSARKPPTEGS